MKKNFIAAFFLLLMNFHSAIHAQTNSSQPLFEKIPSSKTNITFTNPLVENAQFNVLAYEYYYNGGGVAVGDINNDGLPDVYFSSNLKANRLYVNKGNFVFDDATLTSKTGSRQGWKAGCCMADVNGDGWLDIYVCHSGRLPGPYKANELFINNHDLTFTESAQQYGLADTGYSTQAVFFDYDLDGDLDCYLLNHNIATFKNFEVAQIRNTPDANAGDKLFRNDGGHFTDVSRQAKIYSSAIGFGLGVAVSDVNSDGFPDIYVSNDYTEHDYLYINNHDGTFTESLAAMMGHCSNFSMGNDIADYNNDGLPDIFSLDMLPQDNYRQKNLRGPNNYDKYYLQVKFGFYHQVMRNCLQLNNGNGTFSEIGQLAGIPATDWSWAPLLADFDNDGWKDLYITNGYRRDYTNNDFLKFAYEEEKQKAVSEGREPDLLSLVQQMPSVKVSNYLFHNNGDLTFDNATAAWNLFDPAFSNGAAFSDLDNDGDLDLVVNNVDEEAFIYKNNSREINHHHFLTVQLTGNNKNPFGIGSKIEIETATGKQFCEFYMIRGFQSSSDNKIHFGLGNEEKIKSLTITWTDGTKQTLTNIAADQTIKLLQANAKMVPEKMIKKIAPLFNDISAEHRLDFTQQENEYIDYKREPLLPHEFSKLGPQLSTADVNGDGTEDIFIGGAAGFPSKIFFQNKEGKFVEHTSSSIKNDSASEDECSLFFDADRDGDADLYVCSGGYEFETTDSLLLDRLYLNDGKGNFTKSNDALPKMFTSTFCVKANDFDGDGDLDLFVGGRIVPGYYGTAPKSYLLENRNGKFFDVTTSIAPALEYAGMITDAAWGDIDGDKKDDLIVVGEWMQIRIYKNTGSQLTEITNDAGLKNTGGWWNRIVADDLDGDGDIDFVVSNRGENSLMHASVEKPATLFVKDFDKNGSIDPIICYYNGDTSYPMASRDEMVDQLNVLKKKYVYYRDYAGSQISAIFSEDQLKGANILTAQTFSSSLL
ncbi:MAG: VCBS repeat-containing protein, partial [Chitinophagales bacterium]|nr:VCBS repeat-containing protein [Chitinophagales bacterium]